MDLSDLRMAHRMEQKVRDCACGCGRPARRKWASTACRDRCRRDPSRQRHNRGYRADGTKRPSRIAHEEANNARRQERSSGGRAGRLARPFFALPEIAETDLAHACIRLAARVPRDVEIVCWGLDAVVARWCAAEPPDVLTAIVDRQSRIDPAHPYQPPWLTLGPVKVDYLPKHFLRFQPPSGRAIVVNEVAKFFADREPPADLAAAMEQFRRDCAAAGVLPRAWHGPGQGASALLGAHNVKEHLCSIGREL